MDAPHHCMEDFVFGADWTKTPRAAFVCHEAIDSFPAGAVDERGRLDLSVVAADAQAPLSVDLVRFRNQSSLIKKKTKKNREKRASLGGGRDLIGRPASYVSDATNGVLLRASYKIDAIQKGE